MAVREIKTTLALDGEQKFKQEMQAAARELRVLGSEMRANTASFGDNADSMEALSAQSANYERRVAQQSEMVAALTRAVEQSAQMYGEADRRTDGYRIQLNNARAALSNTERQLEQTNEAIDDFSRSSIQAARDSEEMQAAQEELGKTLEVVKGAVLAVAGALTGVFTGAAYFSNESKQALNGLQAQTGATTEEMEKLKETANEIYIDNFGESIKDVADSMAVVTQTTKQIGDELKKTTEQALLMRDTFGYEVKESIDVVNALMANFGITAEQAYNLVAQGAQQGADKNGDMLDTLKEYAPHFAQLGISAEEFTDTLIQGAISGAFQIDKIGDAVKEFSIRSKDMSETSAEGFTLLGLSADQMFKVFANGGNGAEKAFQDVIIRLEKMKNPLDQNTAGVALFGTQFEDLGINGIKALRDIEDYAKADADTLKQLNAIKYDDLGAALEGLKRQLITDLAGPIGDELTPKIGEMIEKIKEFDMTPIINSLKWIMDNASTIAALTVGIGAGMATWSVVSTIMAVVEAVKVWHTAMLAASVAQSGLNFALLANPIGIVVTAVAALAAGIVVLWNTNEGFRNAVIGSWESVKATGEAVFSGISKFFAEDIPAAITTAIDWVSQLPTNLGAFFGQIPGIVSTFLGESLNKVSEFGSDIISWVSTEIPKFVDNIMNFINELPGKIGYALGFALGNIVRFGADAIKWAVTEIPKLIDEIISFFSELPGKTAEQLTNTLNTISQWGVDTISWVANNVPIILDNIISFFSQLPGRVQSQLSSTLNNLVSWARNMLSTIKTEIPKITSSIVSYFAELPGEMLDIGGNIVKGLWDGIKNSASWLLNRINDFAENIIEGFKDAFEINSPSHIMRDQVGIMIGKGMAVGIDGSISEVQAAMARLNRNIIADAEITTNTKVMRSNDQTSRSKGSSNSNNGSLTVKIENFVNNRAQDVQAFAEELEFYKRQASVARGET